MKLKTILFRSLFLLSFLILSATYSFGQKLSNESEISLLTCSPGDELYSQFGHSALRVKDIPNNLDIVFNYGTFNFNTPNFYMKFARGKLKYMLSYSSYDRFKREYVAEKRGIIEQKLNLSTEAKNQLFKALIRNYQPENRYYHYDFLFDNCSTRIRDIIEKNSGSTISFNYETIKTKTFWNLLDPYINQSKWIFLGIHLALGMPCDIEATPYQHMFLPDHLMEGFSSAKIVTDGKAIPLVKSTNTLLAKGNTISTTPLYKRPVLLFAVLAIIGLFTAFFFFRKQFNFYFFDILIFSFVGLTGWLIIFLWFFTDHQATGPNLNILWALPLHFPMAFILLFKKRRKVAYKYFYYLTISLLLIIGLWAFIPQSLPLAVLPLVCLLFIRSLYVTRKLKNSK